VVLFFVGQPVAKVAIVSGALLLLTRRVKAKKVYDTPLCSCGLPDRRPQP
jgi:hypothetical protein